ncbi:hypothetical protein [Hyphomicrobium sp.]|uniref:hypothetical protein n=1 Tax=Hyphomicrobium sp. TaxID=82 RepID=UPI0025C221C0|nr:hypothetical protein [Hyphomicrobium sp.]MCC7253028.1 hypothetical protein [Hyphomicrobium sp.]
MGARVIQLAEARARRAAPQPQLATLDSTSELNDRDRFHFWSGASGQRYVHTVYDLFECPEVPAANFLLVRRDASGHRSVLAIGHLKHNAGSLNLAELRHRGARLGANEVHVHLLAPSAHERRVVELDLRAGGIDRVEDERIAATRH